MKRISALILALTLLLGMSTAARAAETVISVNTPGTMPKAGESFTVTVEISGNPGLCAAQFTLGFDQTKMECTGADVGKVLAAMKSSGCNGDADEGVIVAAFTNGDVTQDGELAVLTFLAKQDIAQWDFSVSDMGFYAADHTEYRFPVTGAATVSDEPAPVTPDEPDERETPAEPDEPETPAEQETDSGYPDVRGADTEYVLYATEQGLFQGYADGTFRPDGIVTRGAYVTVLWRLAGKPAAPAAKFTDIENSNEEFQKAIAWASSLAYVDGYADGTFRPGASVSRRAALKMLYRYNGGVSGAELLFTSIYDETFADGRAMSAAFKPAVYWGYYHELIESDGRNTLGVSRDATRGELARMFALYDEMTS